MPVDPPPVDCCCELERVVKALISMIRSRFNLEKEMCEFTRYLPELSPSSVYFGEPAQIAGLCAVAVVGESAQPKEPFELNCLGGFWEYTLRVHCWYKNNDFQQCHQFVMRMVEVVKRIIMRNRRFEVLMGRPQIYRSDITRINYNEDVVDAFSLTTGIGYGTGQIELTAICHELLVPHPGL